MGSLLWGILNVEGGSVPAGDFFFSISKSFYLILDVRVIASAARVEKM